MAQMTMKDVKFKDALPKAIAAMEAAQQETLESIGEAVTHEAKDRTPVDTGEAKRSWTYELEEDNVNIGNTAEHTLFIEVGTSKQPARPMLQPAMDQYRAKAKKDAEMSLQTHLK